MNQQKLKQLPDSEVEQLKKLSIASLQAPIIMISQKRIDEKDRQRAVNDYMVNLKSGQRFPATTLTRNKAFPAERNSNFSSLPLI